MRYLASLGVRLPRPRSRDVRRGLLFGYEEGGWVSFVQALV
jgi:hypothetical protein